MNPADLLIRQFLAAVDDQLQSGQPPETTAALQRLQNEGFSTKDARLLIAQCVALEFTEALQSDTPFKNERFKQNLKALPATPHKYR